MNKKLLVFLIFVFSITYCFSQNKTLTLPKPSPDPPPGNIELLDGYMHKTEQGIDTAVGKISKKDGLEIRYDIGFLAGNYAMGAYSREEEDVQWFKITKVNNVKAMFVYMKSKKIYVTFGESTNFFANVKNEEELADFLIMMMTYKSNKSENKSKS